MTKATVRPGWLLRTEPSTITGKVIGSTRASGGQIKILQQANGWARVEAWISDAALSIIPDTPPPQTAGKFRVGLNCLYDARTAWAEAKAGCRYFLLMNTFAEGEAIKAAYPDATVILRKYLPTDKGVSDAQAIDFLEGMRHKGVTYMLYNENDQLDDGGAQLTERALQDVRLAEYLKQVNPSARYAAGTFSSGTPDFTNPETCEIIRRIYAPAYNSGLIDFDMHLYTPALNRLADSRAAEWVWYERRFEFLFTKCGFNPNVRRIHASEWGLDILGSGGYKQNERAIPSIPTMIARHAEICAMPMIVGGKSYPSPMIGGALFMAGDNADPRWRDGYDVRAWLPGIRSLY